MTHSSFARLPFLAAALCLAAPSPAAAQSPAPLAARVAAAPAGEVRLTFAARPRACGDGGDVVAVGKALNVYSSMESYGSWSGVTCLPGPARVALTVRDGEVVGIRSFVGGSWRATDATVTDLGRVPAREAASYFLSLATRLGGGWRHNPLLAAALADSADIAPEMLAIARDASVRPETRRRALNWVGVLGGPAMVRPLTEIARSDTDAGRVNADDVGPGNGMAGAATGALAMLEDDAGIPALMELARNGSEGVRKAAVFWLGQGEDPRGRAVVRAVVRDGRERESVRGAAIFALGQGKKARGPNEGAFLREVFGELPSDRLKDRVLMALSQGGSADDLAWLLARVRDERESMEVRRKAAFWAGQGGAPLDALLGAYREVREASLREHLIFVLSQRSERAASDALLEIARADADKRMRSKALFWLAQKDDPRVAKLISDIVLQ